MHALENISDVKLQNVGLGAQELADIGHGPSKVPMHELFNVGAGRGEHVQFEKVLVEQLSLQCIHFLVSFKLTATVKDSHWRLLQHLQISNRVELLIQQFLRYRIF